MKHHTATFGPSVGYTSQFFTASSRANQLLRLLKDKLFLSELIRWFSSAVGPEDRRLDPQCSQIGLKIEQHRLVRSEICLERSRCESDLKRGALL